MRSSSFGSGSSMALAPPRVKRATEGLVGGGPLGGAMTTGGRRTTGGSLAAGTGATEGTTRAGVTAVTTVTNHITREATTTATGDTTAAAAAAAEEEEEERTTTRRSPSRLSSRSLRQTRRGRAAGRGDYVYDSPPPRDQVEISTQETRGGLLKV